MEEIQQEPGKSTELLMASEMTKDIEGEKKKLPLPKQILFIFGNEFCEKYAGYGFRAILGFYILRELHYEEKDSIVILSAFNFLAYFCPLLGAIVADSWLGKYRTILYLSILYGFGNILLAMGAIPAMQPSARALTFIALILTSIGSGGIRPCVSAFGADQFILPEQEPMLLSYFHYYYFIINGGVLLSVFMTPLLRSEVQCFGSETCYPLAFGLPAVLMAVSVGIFIIGKPYYVMKDPKGNVLVQVIKIMWHAAKTKFRGKGLIKKEHWLDHAEDKFPKHDITDLKVTLRFLKLYIPLPIFWALYSQEAVRWLFQAQRMNGLFFGWVIIPEHSTLVNPFLIFVIVPLMDRVVYPLLGKVGLLKKPLQRLITGGVVAGLACIASGLVELELQKTYPTVLVAGEAHLQLVSMAPLNLNATLYQRNDGMSEFELRNNTNYIVGAVPFGNFTLSLKDKDGSTFGFDLHDQEAVTILITQDSSGRTKFTKPEYDNATTDYATYGDVLEKSFEVKPYLRILQYGIWEDPTQSLDPGEVIARNENISITFETEGHSHTFSYDPSEWRATTTVEMKIKTYNIYVDENGNRTLIQEGVYLDIGGSYIVTMVRSEDGDYKTQLNVLTVPNTVSILWMLPQIAILTTAEVLVMITIMEFSYKQAPKSMKSFTQSVWMLTMALGSVILIIFAESQIFPYLWQEYFLYAGLVFVDMILFAILAYYYVPIEAEELSFTMNSTETFEDESEAEKNK